MTTSTTTTKPRSDSTSRNDLFNTSWTTEFRPPKPLTLPPPLPSSPRVVAASTSTLPRLKKDVDTTTLYNAEPTVPSPQVSRTSTFFDKPTELPIPPMNLGRSSSLRSRPPPPLPLDVGSSNHFRTTSKPTTPRPIDSEPLSPLHQSPSLPAVADWHPPRPPCSDDISLRLTQRSMYLLGEGRYATVYLASYKKDRKGKERARNSYLARDNVEATQPRGQGGEELEVNEEGDGFVGGAWRLCAAKRMAPDRQSQTMGLREAFFLNRLASSSVNDLPPLSNTYPSSRARAVSPLRERRDPKSTDRNGSVYVVKLVAVKEDVPPRTAIGHGRSVSDAVQGGPGQLVRQRSSTMMNRLHQNQSRKLDETHSGTGTLNSHPSLPSLAQAAKEIETAPALSRLVLILEHAPLGTMDRFLRTSPGLVGKRLWNRWAVQITDALSWVHGKGIVHADIKAGNLLLTANLDIRLSDFGSSLLIHPSHPPTDGVGLGTLPFSPPELVDPESTFSFPVDIFSLGATLYQCLTGREPYRGCRTIEMMHHVRKGDLWQYEERERLGRIGQERKESIAPSPYPSAWRTDYGGGVKRAGSLRVSKAGQSRGVIERPKLGRMGSTESLRASEDVGHEESPAAVRLWGKWISNPKSGTDPISILLADDPPVISPISPTYASSRSALKVDISTPSPIDTGSEEVYESREPTAPAYSDGTPAMFFLDGQDRVDEAIWKMLRVMLLANKESRPTAEYLRAEWKSLGMYDEEE